jgi:CBS domain-containing protein
MAEIRERDYVRVMKVKEIMTAHARCVAPDNTLVEAAGLMRQLDVGALPVCEYDRLAGMVTDRDIVLRGVADALESATATVSQVMSPGAFFVFADQEIEEAARIMEEKQVRRLPVLNREKKMIGIVSLGDMALNSNPAFSGMALKEVSESADGRMKGGMTDSAFQRAAKAEASGQEKSRSRRSAGKASSTRRGSSRQASRTRKASTPRRATPSRGSTRTNSRRRR